MNFFPLQVGSYFMTNLCLVVITTQFQETKQRENELMKASRKRHATSTSTLNSSRFGKEGCWTEILKYIEHLLRILKRRVMKRFNCKYNGKSRITRTSRRKKSRTKKHIYHHHHHHHHHHHFHHHVSCPIADSLAGTPHVPRADFKRSEEPSRDVPAIGNTLTVPGQVPQMAPSPDCTHTGCGPQGVVPAINIVTGSSCSMRSDPHVPTNGEMITVTKAEVSVNGQAAVADIASRSFVSAASLSSAVAATTASATAASTIQNACACAVQQLDKDMNVEYDTEYVYEEDGGVSDSDFSDDEEKKSKRRLNACWRFRRGCQNAVDSTWFMYVIMGAIFLNTLSMGIEYHGQVGSRVFTARQTDR